MIDFIIASENNSGIVTKILIFVDKVLESCSPSANECLPRLVFFSNKQRSKIIFLNQLLRKENHLVENFNRFSKRDGKYFVFRPLFVLTIENKKKREYLSFRDPLELFLEQRMRNLMKFG